MTTISLKPQQLNTLACPNCGWHGNDYNCGRLTIKEMQAIGIVDKHDMLLSRYSSWDHRYCPICNYVKLILINQNEYNDKIKTVAILDRDTKQ